MAEKNVVLGKDRIILPLDVDNAKDAIELSIRLQDEVGLFKVGMELINSVGYDIFFDLCHMGIKPERVFLDLKFHDIPNTVAGASRAVTKRGVGMFNVHCSGGVSMMKAAKEASLEQAGVLGIDPPLVLGVTVLTSLSYDDLSEINLFDDMLSEAYRASTTMAKEESKKYIEEKKKEAVECLVLKRALAAKNAGLDGVVCSPHEIEAIRKACGKDFLIVTPGVRPAGADVNDQKRVMTPGEAIRKGADYLVIGRPIIKAKSPVAAAVTIAEEIEQAFNLN